MSQTRPTPEPEQPAEAAEQNHPSESVGHGGLGANDSSARDTAVQPMPAVGPAADQPTGGRYDAGVQGSTQQQLRGPDFARPYAQEQVPAGGAAPYGSPQPPSGPPGGGPGAGDPYGGHPGGYAGQPGPGGHGYQGPGGPVGPGGGNSGGSSGRGLPRALLAAVLAAGLIGGGAGAAGMHWATQDSTPAAQQDSESNGGSELEQNSSSSNESEKAPDGSAQAVTEKVLPSVVSISISSEQGAGNGSGVVLSEDGMILTNNHVAEAGQQGELTVTFNNGDTAEASIIGLDPKSDLAVIQAEDASDLQPAELGTSGDLSIGQDVMAIGSPLSLKLSGTVTSGIISAKDRPVRAGENTQATVIDAIQTDAAINPGNSGGALVDMNGNLVGINTAIATVPNSGGGNSGNIGLGFSIPIDQAKPIAEQLMEDGEAEHAQIGVQLEPDPNVESSSSQTPEGALVRQVSPGTPAEEAGLQQGDVVTQVNDRQVADSDSLIAAVRSYRPGDKVDLTYARNGNEDTVSVTLGSDTDQ